MWKYLYSVKDNPKSGYDWSTTGQLQTAFCVCQREHWECRRPCVQSERQSKNAPIESWDLMWNWHSVTDCTASMHHWVPCTHKNDILGSWLIACCKLAPTLARQMWRHNDVIGRIEYLIFTYSESTVPWVYSLQFLYVSGCFFSEHSVYAIAVSSVRLSFRLSVRQVYHRTRKLCYRKDDRAMRAI